VVWALRCRAYKRPCNPVVSFSSESLVPAIEQDTGRSSPAAAFGAKIIVSTIHLPPPAAHELETSR
jgi:hypothetical protein